MKRNYKRALDFVLKWEGGDVNDPKDPGGATRRGISLLLLRAIGLDVNGDGAVDAADVWALTDAAVARIYKERFADVVHFDELPDGVDLIIFGSAVNQGPGRAIRFLQRAVGVAADGVLGPATLAAVRAKAAEDVVYGVAWRRAVHYTSLVALFTRFGKGWLRRLFDAHREALRLAWGVNERL